MSFVLSSLFFVFLRPSGELAIIAACRAAVRGSKPRWGANAAQARMVVQLSCKQQAVGSNPTSGSNRVACSDRTGIHGKERQCSN